MADTINNIAAKMSGQENKNKETEIDRIQYTGDNHEELKRFCGPYLGYVASIVPTIFSKPDFEGEEQQISKGDWILKLSDTEFKVIESRVYDMLTKYPR